MKTLKQSVRLGGEPISNLDPEMVITLDGSDAVQIHELGESTITYKFTKDVDQDVVYDLNLTFEYQGTYAITKPLKITHNKIPVIVTPTPVTVNVWQQGDTLPFNVMYGNQLVSDKVTNVKISEHEHVKTAESSSDIWWIHAEDKMELKEITVDVEFELDFQPGVKHQGKGMFNILPYDGVEIKASILSADPRIIIPVLGKKSYDFEVWYRGKNVPVHDVIFDHDNSMVRPASIDQASSRGNNQIRLDFDGGNIAGRGIANIEVFATNDSKGIEGKDKVTLRSAVHTTLFGLDPLEGYENIQGQEKDQVIQYLEFTEDGEIISTIEVNITPENEDYVKLVEKGKDFVIWEITKANPGTDPIRQDVVFNIEHNGVTGNYTCPVVVEPASLLKIKTGLKGAVDANLNDDFSIPIVSITTSDGVEHLPNDERFTVESNLIDSTGPTFLSASENAFVYNNNLPGSAIAHLVVNKITDSVSGEHGYVGFLLYSHDTTLARLSPVSDYQNVMTVAGTDSYDGFEQVRRFTLGVVRSEDGQ